MTIKWIHQFGMFLFDFDGLLVNTEHLHFAAYIKMCKDRGFDLKWDFNRFCIAAHFNSGELRRAIYEEFPALYIQEPIWDVLYAEKKKAYLEILKQGNLQLMPGVERLLLALKDANIKRCVATNSAREQIDCIKEQLPALKSIPLWITRENYENPKPAPDAYLKALEILGGTDKRVIGLEDTLRGVKALQGAKTEAILVCPVHHPQIKEVTDQSVFHFESLDQIPDDATF